MDLNISFQTGTAFRSFWRTENMRRGKQSKGQKHPVTASEKGWHFLGINTSKEARFSFFPDSDYKYLLIPVVYSGEVSESICAGLTESLGLPCREKEKISSHKRMTSSSLSFKKILVSMERKPDIPKEDRSP